jgi:hypothetical protein
MRSSKPLFPRANPSLAPEAISRSTLANAELLLKQGLHEVTKTLDLLLLDLALGATANQLAAPTEVSANEVFPFAFRHSEGPSPTSPSVQSRLRSRPCPRAQGKPLRLTFGLPGNASERGERRPCAPGRASRDIAPPRRVARTPQLPRVQGFLRGHDRRGA